MMARTSVDGDCDASFHQHRKATSAGSVTLALTPPLSPLNDSQTFIDISEPLPRQAQGLLSIGREALWHIFALLRLILRLCNLALKHFRVTCHASDRIVPNIVGSTWSVVPGRIRALLLRQRSRWANRWSALRSSLSSTLEFPFRLLGSAINQPSQSKASSNTTPIHPTIVHVDSRTDCILTIQIQRYPSSPRGRPYDPSPQPTASPTTPSALPAKGLAMKNTRPCGPICADFTKVCCRRTSDQAVVPFYHSSATQTEMVTNKESGIKIDPIAGSELKNGAHFGSGVSKVYEPSCSGGELSKTKPVSEHDQSIQHTAVEACSPHGLLRPHAGETGMRAFSEPSAAQQEQPELQSRYTSSEALSDMLSAETFSPQPPWLQRARVRESLNGFWTLPSTPSTKSFEEKKSVVSSDGDSELSPKRSKAKARDQALRALSTCDNSSRTQASDQQRKVTPWLCHTARSSSNETVTCPDDRRGRLEAAKSGKAGIDSKSIPHQSQHHRFPPTPPSSSSPPASRQKQIQQHKQGAGTCTATECHTNTQGSCEVCNRRHKRASRINSKIPQRIKLVDQYCRPGPRQRGQPPASPNTKYNARHSTGSAYGSLLLKREQKGMSD